MGGETAASRVAGTAPPARAPRSEVANEPSGGRGERGAEARARVFRPLLWKAGVQAPRGRVGRRRLGNRAIPVADEWVGLPEPLAEEGNS